MLTLSSALTGHRSTYSSTSAASASASCGFGQGITTAAREHFYGASLHTSARTAVSCQSPCFPVPGLAVSQETENCGKAVDLCPQFYTKC
ncbi:hypothetical protein ElyMa_004757600 [Elysia marginata]|uniref:Secreted protein n=1 Tax=Elysia marginata TaxID=1093978 RepID=A0AAV4IH87_9GAST|nr:hypothetical protein ElyMa_004757600 [Elysia marginata]